MITRLIVVMLYESGTYAGCSEILAVIQVSTFHCHGLS